MVDKRSWEEFRETKLLWFVNNILHLFGWAIVYQMSDEDPTKLISVYPARVKFRGFSESSNTDGYIGLTKYMVDNAKELYEEAKN
jgi:hypothetical protein